MSRRLRFASAVVAAALSLAAVPAGAQDRGGDRQQRGRERATQRGPAARQDGAPQAVRRSSVNPQSSAPRVMARESGSRQYSAPQMAPRSPESRQPSAPPAMPRGNPSRQYSAPQTAPRSPERRQPSAPQAMPRGNGGRQGQQRASPQSYERFQSPGYRPDNRWEYAQPRGGYGAYYTRPYVRPHNFVPYSPFYFSRPYYSFRPRLSIGFGLWLGVSVPYPWSYFGVYRPRVYGYYPDGYYGGWPGAQYYGGVSFDIQPSDADLYVDGEYVGTVGTFTPYGEPLTLMPGLHRIAIEREGFRTIEWEVRIEPGQVIPFRGVMELW